MQVIAGRVLTEDDLGELYVAHRLSLVRLAVLLVDDPGLAEEHREILAALDRLAPRQREVLVLRYWSGLTEAEIAETLGISRGAVKSTASRALDRLEKIMGGEPA